MLPSESPANSPPISSLDRRRSRAYMIACASPRYLKLRGTPRTPQELVEHNCLTQIDGSIRASWKFTRNGKTTSVKVSGNCSGNSGDRLMRAADAGVGIVYEPTFILAEGLRRRKLVQVLPEWKSETFTVYAVYVNREYLPPKVRTFIDFLAEWFERHGASVGAEVSAVPQVSQSTTCPAAN